MTNKQGFTLIEVVLSIAILGIISVFFLGSMVNHYEFLSETKNITEDVFLTQREIEEEIDSVKKEILDLKNGVVISDPRPVKTKKILKDLDESGEGIEVKYYEVEKSLNSKEYFTFVANIRPEPLDVIKLDTIDLNLKYNNNNVEYGYSISDYVIEGNFKNLESTKYDHMLNQVEWYVSSDKFNMPMPKSPTFDMNDDFDYNSFYFPLFPKDYELVDNETVFKFGSSTNTFEKLSVYGGHHIVYSVTPAAKSGKLGESMESEPIFISGLPIKEELDLIMHFDASYIDITMGDEVDKISDDWFVKKWLDISSIINNKTPYKYAIYNGYNKPQVKRTGEDTEFIGQYVNFNTNQRMKVDQTSTDDIIVLSVVKNRSESIDTKYLENGDVSLKIGPHIPEGDYDWRVELDVIHDSSLPYIFGGNNTDIAEIIVYQGPLDEDNLEIIEDYIIDEYLTNKYIHIFYTGKIFELEDISKEIVKGDSFFELPKMVNAEMNTGINKDVCIKWEGSFNINAEGVYRLTGIALADPNKNMEYTLTVLPE